jgi:Ser/Thr protein kinase RdoA (MazF antagonist)
MAEYAVVKHLAAAGMPVAVPILTDDSQPFACVQEQFYMLAPVLLPRTTTPVTNQAELFTNIGRALARLHQALANYVHDFPAWTMNLPDKLVTEIEPFLAQHLSPQLLAPVSTVLGMIAEPMHQALADLPMQRIHGDCHGGNILWDSSDVYGIIDIDHLPIGPRTYDLGHLLADMVKTRIEDPEQLNAWLNASGWLMRGYERENALTEREKNALWFSMLASQLLFIHWFAQHEQTELTAKNVAVLLWIYQQQEVITVQIKAGG